MPHEETRGRRRIDMATLSHGVLVIGSCVPLAAIIFLSLSNRFQADDYSIAARFRSFGLFGTMVNQVQTLNGRFTGFAVSDVLALFGPRGAVFTTWLMLGALVVTIWAAVPPQPGRDVIRRSAVALTIAATLVLAAPAPDQVFLWISGMGMITTSLVFAAITIAAARRSVGATGRARPAWLGATALAGFLTSNSYETTGILLLVAAAGAGVALGWKDRLRLAATGAVAGGALIGVLVVAAMPGTWIRKSVLGGAPAETAFEIGLRDTVSIIEGMARTEALWLAFGAGLIAVAPTVPVARALRWGLVGAVATFLAIWAALTMSAWTTGGMPPARTQTAIVALFAVCLFLFGWLVPLPRTAGAAVGIALVALVVQSSGVLYDRIEPRQEWAEAWDKRDDFLRKAPAQGIIEVPVLGTPEGLEDFTGDRTSWVNEAAARYYGVEAIVAVSPPEE